MLDLMLGAYLAATGPRVEVHVVDARMGDKSEDVVGEACKVLRVRCDIRPMGFDDMPEEGTVSLMLTDWGPMQLPDGGWALGVMFGRGTCAPVGWSDAQVLVVAHELGHALGLTHSEDDEDLMHHTAKGGDDLSRREHRTMRKGARALSKCR